MKNIMAVFAFLIAGTANAGPIELDWSSTAASFTGSFPSVPGEAITTTFTVDNGGSSSLSQYWTEDDFVSYRMEGSSGWWFESIFIDTLSSTGQFSTDALGDVITAGNWFGGYSSAIISTSWSGVINGGWWNNGTNEVVCTADSGCVLVVNVLGNVSGSSWSAPASSSISVTAPTSLVMLGLGLIGVSFSRKNKNS